MTLEGFRRRKVATVPSIISLADCEPKRDPWREPTGNVVSPVVCVNAAGKVGPRFPSRGTIHLQKFLEITSRAKAQWKRRRAERQDERTTEDRRRVRREDGKGERERERDERGEETRERDKAWNCFWYPQNRDHSGKSWRRPKPSLRELPVFERYINKLRFVFGKVQVVFDYDAIVRARVIDEETRGKRSEEGYQKRRRFATEDVPWIKKRESTSSS